MASTIASRKAKGRRLTQEVCAMLLSISHHFKWGLTDEDIRPVPGSVIGEDIWLSPAAREKFPFSFECKNQEKVNIWASWKQCLDNAGDHQPILVIKRNNEGPRIIMDMLGFTCLLFGRGKAIDILHQPSPEEV